MKVVAIGCSCDLPARTLILKFNGYYGCWFCEQSGKSTGTDKGGHVQTWPFEADLHLREVHTWQQNAAIASTSHPVRCIMHKHCMYNDSYNVAIDQVLQLLHVIIIFQ